MRDSFLENFSRLGKPSIKPNTNLGPPNSYSPKSTNNRFYLFENRILIEDSIPSIPFCFLVFIPPLFQKGDQFKIYQDGQDQNWDHLGGMIIFLTLLKTIQMVSYHDIDSPLLVLFPIIPWDQNQPAGVLSFYPISQIPPKNLKDKRALRLQAGNWRSS